MTSSKHSIYFLLVIASSYYQFANADLVSQICSKSRNPVYCNQVLKANQSSSKLDLKHLAQITVDKAMTIAKSGKVLAGTLLSSEKDSNTLELYKKCVKKYGDAMDALDECTSSLSIGDRSGLNIHASAAMDHPRICDDGLKRSSKPFEFTVVSKELQDLGNIILVISNML